MVEKDMVGRINKFFEFIKELIVVQKKRELYSLNPDMIFNYKLDYDPSLKGRIYFLFYIFCRNLIFYICVFEVNKEIS